LSMEELRALTEAVAEETRKYDRGR
jgi:hypothetical protein